MACKYTTLRCAIKVISLNRPAVALLLLLIHCSNCQENVLETKECRERDRLVAAEKEDLYGLVDAIEGQTLVLRCRFCNEPYSEQPKNWIKVDQLGITKRYELKLDMNAEPRVSVNHKHSLIITKFSRQDTGFYSCIHYEDKTNDEKFNYLVDLVLPNKPKDFEKGTLTDWCKYHDDFFVTINNLFTQSQASEFVYWREILKVGAELTTQWDTWGECQSCGRAKGDGVRKKVGRCRIKLTSGVDGRNSTPTEIYLHSAPALSCRSNRLLDTFPNISRYTRTIPDFVLEESCEAECNPDAEGTNKGWKVGKSKGFKYKKISVLEEGSHLTFICPESTFDSDVVWSKSGRKLKSGDNSNPHVIVDTFNTLYVVEVTKKEAGNYTCFVGDIRMQQIIIYVYGKSKIISKELLRYFVYLGFILFLSSFCYCAGLVITWKRKHLFKKYQELKDEEEATKRSDTDMETLI